MSAIVWKGTVTPALLGDSKPIPEIVDMCISAYEYARYLICRYQIYGSTARAQRGTDERATMSSSEDEAVDPANKNDDEIQWGILEIYVYIHTKCEGMGRKCCCRFGVFSGLCACVVCEK